MTAKEGVLVMATNAAFPPYEYKEGDSFAGIDVEIATKIAEKLGLTLEIQDVGLYLRGGVKVKRLDINHLDNSLMKNSLSGEPDFSIFPFSLERFL